MQAVTDKLIPAVAYARVSTESQADDELPITAQLDEIRRFAANRGCEIVEEYVDAGITGRTEDRPEFTRLRKAISSGKAHFQAVIVWRSNRFARSARIAQGFRFLLEQKNIRLYSVTEPEMNGSVGVLMNGILDAFNEFYSAQLGEDTYRGMIAGAKAGYAMGGVTPFGLQRVPVILESGGVKKKYAPHPEQAAVVKKIYDLYISGMGLFQVARTLNSEGIKTKTGKDWEMTSIHHILHKNRQYYLGNMIFNRSKTVVKKRVAAKDPSEWILTEGTHEAIITQEMANAVDKRHKEVGPMKMESNGHSKGRNLLNGLAFCGLCGRPYSGQGAHTGKGENRKKVWYYACTSRKSSIRINKSDLCSNAYIRQEIIEDTVLEEIRKCFCDPAVLERVMNQVQTEFYQGNDEKEERARQLRKERADLDKRRSNLLDAVEQGALPLQDVAERLNKTRIRLKEIDALLSDIDQTSGNGIDLGELDLNSLASDIKIILNDPLRRREAYVSFIERLEVFPEQVKITFRLPVPDDDPEGDKRKDVRGIRLYLEHSPR